MEHQQARDHAGIWRLALVVFGVALIVRLCWVSFAHVTPISDFLRYDQAAWKWLQQGHYSSPPRLAYGMPGYPGFLAVIYAVFGHNVVAAAAVQAVLTALTSGLLVVLASFVLSRRASVSAGLLYAFSPTALAYVPVLASENLAVPLVVAGCLCLLAAATLAGWRRDLMAGGAGILCGLLLLVRPAGLFFMPAHLFLALYSPQRRCWRPTAFVAFALAVGAALAPWVIRNYAAGLGLAPLSTNGGLNLWLGNNPEALHGGYCMNARTFERTGEKEDDARYRRAALDWIRANPGRYAALCRVRASRFLGGIPDNWAARYLTPTAESDDLITRYYEAARQGRTLSDHDARRLDTVRRRNRDMLTNVRVLIAPLVLLGLLLTIARWREYAAITLPALCYILGLSLTYFQPRFRELANPLLAIPLAALLSDLFSGTSDLGRWPSRAHKWVLAIALVLASGYVYLTGVSASWYRLKPMPPEAPDTSISSFEPIELDASGEGCRSPIWAVRVDRVRVTKDRGSYSLRRDRSRRESWPVRWE